MTVEQAKQLQYGDRIYTHDGRRVITLKVNGAPKVWKRSPERVEVPVKYGLYTYDRLSEHDVHRYHRTVEEAERS